MVGDAKQAPWLSEDWPWGIVARDTDCLRELTCIARRALENLSSLF
jgi:hypothetical protein